MKFLEYVFDLTWLAVVAWWYNTLPLILRSRVRIQSLLGGRKFENDKKTYQFVHWCLIKTKVYKV
jgi:hypothetical protein